MLLSLKRHGDSILAGCRRGWHGRFEKSRLLIYNRAEKEEPARGRAGSHNQPANCERWSELANNILDTPSDSVNPERITSDATTSSTKEMSTLANNQSALEIPTTKQE